MDTHHDFMIDTPIRYAKRLAGYISSPTKIESLTRMEFGRAPPLRTIQNMRLLVENAPTREIGEPRDCDALDWSVRTFVPKADPEKPRQRDYIHVAPQPLPEVTPEAANPFLGLYRTGARVIESVAYDFYLEPHEITGRARHKHLIEARAVVAATLIRWGRKSYPEIGRIMGGRDHSTVINSVNKFDIYCRRNPLVWPSYGRHVKLIEEAEAALRECEAA